MNGYNGVNSKYNNSNELVPQTYNDCDEYYGYYEDLKEKKRYVLWAILFVIAAILIFVISSAISIIYNLSPFFDKMMWWNESAYDYYCLPFIMDLLLWFCGILVSSIIFIFLGKYINKYLLILGVVLIAIITGCSIYSVVDDLDGKIMNAHKLTINSYSDIKEFEKNIADVEWSGSNLSVKFSPDGKKAKIEVNG